MIESTALPEEGGRERANAYMNEYRQMSKYWKKYWLGLNFFVASVMLQFSDLLLGWMNYSVDWILYY